MPKKRNEPYVKWKISLPLAIAGRINLLTLTDGSPLYGARSEIVRLALEEFLERRYPRPNSPTIPSLETPPDA